MRLPFQGVFGLTMKMRKRKTARGEIWLIHTEADTSYSLLVMIIRQLREVVNIEATLTSRPHRISKTR